MLLDQLDTQDYEVTSIQPISFDQDLNKHAILLMCPLQFCLYLLHVM